MTTSVRDAARELRLVARAATDASGYFPALYARVTERIAAAIDDGRFADGAGMDRFATAFAAHYLRVVPPGAARPRCWQACWDVAGDAELLVVQHLLLGINAHVNHDLPLAVVEVAGEGDLAPFRADFDAVNDVLAETYAEVVGALGRVSRWSGLIVALGGDRLFRFSLRVARRQAWSAAERLHGLAGDEAGRAAHLAELDRLVSVLAYLVTRPPAWARPLVWLARRLEERDPRTVVAALLDER